MDSENVNNGIEVALNQIIETNGYQGDSKPKYMVLKWNDYIGTVLSIN